MADLLSKYRSLSRPSLLSGSSSGTYSSYAKKQASAEDAIIDNQYESGLLSPDTYLQKLQERSLRSWATPLQKVNINEKIQNVQSKVMDAKVSQGYSAGNYTTDQVLQYEQDKLNKMTEPGSAAYIQQQQKVQQLQDKSEKEKRATYRTQELLRISQLPNDSSATLWQKAQLYKDLADKARLDGDVQQADSLETQANNFTASAKRADINDLITGARLQTSEPNTAGLGVPSSQGGIGRLGGEAPGAGGSVAGTTTPAGVSTGFSGGVSNSAVKNALESLDRKYKVYERTAQDLQGTNNMISAYQNAISQAEGDQKTQLQVALNNLLESKATKENSLANLEVDIQDTVGRVQEAQQKAAASAFTQEVRKNDKQFATVENDLETEFSKGRITKEEYIQKGIALAAMKSQFYSQSSDVFNSYGNDNSAQTFLDKAAQMEQIHQNLTGVGQNLGDYEPVVADPTGKVTNLLGKSVQPGDIALTNVRQLKDSGDFEANFVDNGNGVFQRIHYPGFKSVLGDQYISKSAAEELSKNAKDPAQAPFIYGVYKPEVGPSTGQIKKLPLVKEPTTGQWMTQQTYDKVKKQETQTVGSALNKVLNKTDVTSMLKTPAAKTVPKTGAQRLLDNLFPGTQQATLKQNAVSSAISGIGSGAKSLFDKAISGAKGLLSSAKDKITGVAQNFQVPSIVKKAYATYDNTTPDQIMQYAKQAEAATGVPAELIIAQYKLESGSGASAPGNNYFGITGKGTAGSQRLRTVTHYDKKGNPVYGYQNFAVYNTPEESFIAHAKLLSGDKRYANVMEAAKTGDLAKVAEAIGKSPYARDPNYGQKVADIMGVKIGVPKVQAAAEPLTPVSPQGDVSGPGLYTTRKSGNTTTITKEPIMPKTNFNVVPAFKPPVANPNQLIPSIPPANIGEAARNFYDNTPALKNTVSAVQNATKNLGYNVSQGFKSIAQPAVQKVQQIAAPVIQKVQQAAKPVTNFVSSAVSKLKSLFGR